MKAFIVKVESGQIAYGEKDEVVFACLGKNSIVPKLLEMGYTKEDIYYKKWVNLSDKVLGLG